MLKVLIITHDGKFFDPFLQHACCMSYQPPLFPVACLQEENQKYQYLSNNIVSPHKVHLSLYHEYHSLFSDVTLLYF